MRKIYLFFLLLCMQFFFAQFTENDIKFWVGTGSKKAYFIADFNDSNTPKSYAWGYRFDADNLMAEDMINAIASAEPKMQADILSGFLFSFAYNHHAPSTDDYWIPWFGSSAENMSNNNNGPGSVSLTDGLWFGITYGSDDAHIDTPPSTPVPAYNSKWYTPSQITNWIGTGSNKSLVVVDFGTNSSNGNANSFVFGIQYNGSITAEQALQLIQSQASYFSFTASNGQVSNLSVNNFTGNSNWKLYKGKDLSSWQKKTNLSEIQLSNNQWMGLSFGDRRPFTPTEASNATLGVSSVQKKAFRIYPNPTSDFIQVESPENIKEVNIYSALGQKVITSQATKINVKFLDTGIYWMEIKTNNNSTIHKIVKK
ncbi:T9SS C-terminal target domain-containing protein [Chryseobacterium sp. G0186]|uniref:T9SS type A sorting domain-containing protein n=1 Tax=Chryseobacterium sp. G0186 TaxID=2487064 RepID=UPI000F5063E4|nr:T9SS type A sorting domain-containing protein [Chryseobacterium sp. G0186]AZA79898.1 T9SS C-terminal target domain-containing protein [Chryseobacterium sp. G0186]